MIYIMFLFTPFTGGAYDLLKEIDNVLINTILIELSGIRIAAISGVKLPVIAKVNPAIL